MKHYFNPSSPDRDPLLDLIIEGVSASVVTAWEDARRYNTSLIVWQDGKIVEIPPEELPNSLRGEVGFDRAVAKR